MPRQREITRAKEDLRAHEVTSNTQTPPNKPGQYEEEEGIEQTAEPEGQFAGDHRAGEDPVGADDPNGEDASLASDPDGIGKVGGLRRDVEQDASERPGASQNRHGDRGGTS